MDEPYPSISYPEPIQCKSFEEIPFKYRTVFSDYPSLNPIQSIVFDDIFYTNTSVVVAAPTGSGKTLLFELAIIKLLMDREKMNIDNDFKIVYVAPVKALCTERYQDWSAKFSTIGVSCVEVTGDSGNLQDLLNYTVILTTPEKWDSLTRKWRDNLGLVEMVKLFLIDEVHLLNEDKRGPVLEAIVSRMKTVSSSLKLFHGMELNLRFIAVSATIYNVEDLAAWLGTKTDSALSHKFGNEMRPVKLKKIVKGYVCPENKNSFLFDIHLSYKVKQLLMEHANGKPALIFCSTRKGVAQTSVVLAQQITFQFSEPQMERLRSGACEIMDNKLKELILNGIGYHHAGMHLCDRLLVQELFSSGDLPILIATSTLAMGVNLPAHLVVVKSTQQFVAGKVTEYPENTVLQMIGRAGRPQFDSCATAIIMTKTNMVAKYERMLDSKEIVESSLHKNLTEHLNSEIVLYTITDISVAMEWLRTTYFYVRALKNPKFYGFEADAGKERIENKLQEVCVREINALNKAGLINVDPNGMDITPTANGKLMSHFYLSFETFKIFLNIKGTETIDGILEAVANAYEFQEIQLRVNERKTLNDLNKNKTKDGIRFPINSKIKTSSMKINCLIQACLGCLPIVDPALQQEAARLIKIAERITKCLSEFLSRKNFYQSMLAATVLAKCLHAKLWSNSPLVSRQLDRIGSTLGSLLAAHGKTSFQALEDANPRDLERILNRAPPFGNVLQDAVIHLPKYELSVVVEEQVSGNIKLDILVTIVNSYIIEQRSTSGDCHYISLIIGNSNNILLGHHRFQDLTLLTKPFSVSIQLKVNEVPEKIFIHLLSEQWVGLDVEKEVELLPETIGVENVEPKAKKTKIARKPKATQQDLGSQLKSYFKKYEADRKVYSTQEKELQIDRCVKKDALVGKSSQKNSSALHPSMLNLSCIRGYEAPYAEIDFSTIRDGSNHEEKSLLPVPTNFSDSITQELSMNKNDSRKTDNCFGNSLIRPSRFTPTQTKLLIPDDPCKNKTSNLWSTTLPDTVMFDRDLMKFEDNVVTHTSNMENLCKGREKTAENFSKEKEEASIHGNQNFMTSNFFENDFFECLDDPSFKLPEVVPLKWNTLDDYTQEETEHEVPSMSCEDKEPVVHKSICDEFYNKRPQKDQKYHDELFKLLLESKMSTKN